MIGFKAGRLSEKGRDRGVNQAQVAASQLIFRVDEHNDVFDLAREQGHNAQVLQDTPISDLVFFGCNITDS